MFEAYVKPLEVLADEHDVDVLVATALHHGASGSHIRKKLEFLPEADID